MRMWNRPARSGPKQCARDVRDTPAAADSSGALPPISQEAAHLSGAAAVPTTVPRMPICSLASGVDLPYGFARCREPGVRRVAPEGIGFWTGTWFSAGSRLGGVRQIVDVDSKSHAMWSPTTTGPPMETRTEKRAEGREVSDGQRRSVHRVHADDAP